MRALLFVVVSIFSLASFASETFQGSLSFEQSSILQGELINGEAFVECYQRSTKKSEIRKSKEFLALVASLEKLRHAHTAEQYDSVATSANIYVAMLLRKY